MPLHAYIGPKEPHVVHLVQDWTLGFLYARLAARVIFSDRASRPARAFSAVIQNGYLYPNAGIATRCFLLPTVALFTSAIAVPSLFALSMNKTLYLATDATTKSQVWRFSYPAIGLTLVAFWAANMAIGVVKRWRLVVRDEVYLIGERLHNFGDKRALPAPPPVSTPVAQE
jgi:E3 ubiquitin-protein ligase MARCH6